MTTSEPTAVVSDEVEEEEERGESGLSDSGNEFVVDVERDLAALLVVDSGTSVMWFSFSSSSTIFNSFSDFPITELVLVVSADSIELKPSNCWLMTVFVSLESLSPELKFSRIMEIQ